MYEVIYSGRVIDALRALAARNPAHPFVIAAALREIDRRLRFYPQFGQPLRDLSVGSAQLWIGVVSLLVFHYVLEEEPRRVTVLRPPVPLPRSGIV
jgi:hypothetical protein